MSPLDIRRDYSAVVTKTFNPEPAHEHALKQKI